MSIARKRVFWIHYSFACKSLWLCETIFIHKRRDSIKSIRGLLQRPAINLNVCNVHVIASRQNDDSTIITSCHSGTITNVDTSSFFYFWNIINTRLYFVLSDRETTVGRSASMTVNISWGGWEIRPGCTVSWNAIARYYAGPQVYDFSITHV